MKIVANKWNMNKVVTSSELLHYTELYRIIPNNLGGDAILTGKHGLDEEAAFVQTEKLIVTSLSIGIGWSSLFNQEARQLSG